MNCSRAIYHHPNPGHAWYNLCSYAELQIDLLSFLAVSATPGRDYMKPATIVLAAETVAHLVLPDPGNDRVPKGARRSACLR